MTAPDRTLYAVSVVADPETSPVVYGPSYVQAFDLDTGDLIATSPTMGGVPFSTSLIWCVAYDYQGSVWGLGPGVVDGSFVLVQMDAGSLDILNTFDVPYPTDPATSDPINGQSGITFSSSGALIWAADVLSTGGHPEEGLVSYGAGPTLGSVLPAQRQTGTYEGTPYWVQTPLHGTQPLAFTLGVADGNCVLLSMNLCPGQAPGWTQVAIIGTEAARPYYVDKNWFWDYAGPVVTGAGIYVLTNDWQIACETLNLYDLNDYSLLQSWDISSIGVPASGFGGYNPRPAMNFAVDSINNVAYVATASWRADGSGTDGLGYSYLWSVDLSTGDVAYVTEIPYYYPVSLGGPNTTIPAYPSGATLHISLPTAPVVSCGPWFPLPPLRMTHSSHPLLSNRMTQAGSCAASPFSTRQYGAGTHL